MIKRHENSLGKRLAGFAGVSVATLGIGFQANAGEKTWDFEQIPLTNSLYRLFTRGFRMGWTRLG